MGGTSVGQLTRDRSFEAENVKTAAIAQVVERPLRVR